MERPSRRCLRHSPGAPHFKSKLSSTSILQDSGRFLQQGAFNVDCESLVVHEKSVYTLEDMKIQVHKQTLYNANLTC